MSRSSILSNPLIWLRNTDHNNLHTSILGSPYLAPCQEFSFATHLPPTIRSASVLRVPEATSQLGLWTSPSALHRSLSFFCLSYNIILKILHSMLCLLFSNYYYKNRLNNKQKQNKRDRQNANTDPNAKIKSYTTLHYTTLLRYTSNKIPFC